MPESFEEHVALMFDLLALAYEADLTRVFTFMMAREVSQRTYPQIGVTEPHHSISHHGNKPDKIAGHAKINAYHVSLFAKFLERLRSTPDGDGSLLDHSLIVYGSGMSNGNGHTPYAAAAGDDRIGWDRSRATGTSSRRTRRRARTSCSVWASSSASKRTASASARARSSCSDACQDFARVRRSTGAATGFSASRGLLAWLAQCLAVFASLHRSPRRRRRTSA